MLPDLPPTFVGTSTGSGVRISSPVGTAPYGKAVLGIVTGFTAKDALRIAEIGYDNKMGARPLSRKINDLIKVPLSKKILFETVPPNSIIEVDWNSTEFTFDILDTFVSTMPVIDSNGYIRLDTVES